MAPSNFPFLEGKPAVSLSEMFRVLVTFDETASVVEYWDVTFAGPLDSPPTKIENLTILSVGRVIISKIHSSNQPNN